MPLILDRFDAYCEAAERARLQAFRGRSPASELLAEVDSRFEDLSSGDCLGQLEAAVHTATLTAQIESNRRQHRALESSVLEARARALPACAELQERSIRSPVAIPAELERPLGVHDAAQQGDWRASLAGEPLQELRSRTQAALDRSVGEHNELREELFARRGDLRCGLGFESGRARAEALRPQIAHDAWELRCRTLLDACEGSWIDGLRAACVRMGVREEPTQADLPWVLQTRDLDALLPARRMLDCMDFALRGMRLQLNDLQGVAVEHVAGADADARCFAIRPTFDVVLVARGNGGVEGVRSFFAAGARALLWHFASESLAVDQTRAIDPALPMAWSLLFEDLIADPLWAEESPAQLRVDEFVHRVRLRRLLEVRSVAGQVIHEVGLAALPGGADPHALASAWAEQRRWVTGCSQSASGYLLRADAELGSVDAMRARCLAAALAVHLRERFGSRFWKEPGAGSLLRELWNTGGTYSAEELSAALGLGELQIDLLLVDAAKL